MNAQGELSLLDLAVVIAEHWLFICVVPLLAGLASLGIFSLTTPPTYDSIALLRLDGPEAAMLVSTRTLNPAIVGSSYLDEFEGSFSRASQNLVEELLSVTREGETELYRVRMRYKSAAGAQELLSKIVNSLIANSAPTPSQAMLLAIKIDQAKRSISELESNLARTNRLAEIMEGGSVFSAVTIGEFGETLVALTGSIEERYARVFALEESLKGSVSVEDVIQPATLPDSPNPDKVLAQSFLVALAFGLAALVFSFVLAGWNNASQSVDGDRKIRRIRRAFRLDRRPDVAP